MSAHHTKTIVVDFDDTLAITLNRDWQNAQPNIPLIIKLNGLFDDGWDIHVVTARGQISCAGDCEAADKKYREQIEEWLSKHDVKFSSLSFQKKLASYYIDDKGIHPDDFLVVFDRETLKGGMSGAEVFYDKASNAVFKTAKNTSSAIEWYTHAEELLTRYTFKPFVIPHIDSVIGDTIKMQKLAPFSGQFFHILMTCKIFAAHPPIHVGLLPYRYVDRCINRCQKDLEDSGLDIAFIKMLLSYAVENTANTFSHGDYSISNIMSPIRSCAVALIDPINDPTLLSSWIIDLAKLYTSIRLEFGIDDCRLQEILDFAIENDLSTDLIFAHEIGHLCRMIPYVTDSKMKDKIIDRIKEIVQVFKCGIMYDAIKTTEVMNYVSK